MNTPTLRGAVLGGLTAAVGFGIFAMWAPATASADTVLMVGGADIQAFPGAENGVYMPAILGELCARPAVATNAWSSRSAAQPAC